MLFTNEDRKYTVSNLQLRIEIKRKFLKLYGKLT